MTLLLHAEELANADLYDATVMHTDSTLSIDTYRAASLEDGEEIRNKTTFNEKIKAMAVWTCENQRWCVLMHLMAMSIFLKQPIWSIYTNANKALRPLLHRQISFGEGKVKNPIYIMWTRDGDLDPRKGSLFEPNHFVSLIPTKHNDEFPDFGSDDEDMLQLMKDCLLYTSDAADDSVYV